MKEFTSNILIPAILICLMVTSITDRLAIVSLTDSIRGLTEIATIQRKSMTYIHENVSNMSKYQDDMTYLYYGVAKIAIETKLKNDVLYSTMNKIVDILKEISQAANE